MFTDPKFAEPIVNVTAPVGREAILVCVVDELSGFKVNSRETYSYKIGLFARK